MNVYDGEKNNLDGIFISWSMVIFGQSSEKSPAIPPTVTDTLPLSDSTPPPEYSNHPDQENESSNDYPMQETDNAFYFFFVIVFLSSCASFATYHGLKRGLLRRFRLFKSTSGYNLSQNDVSD